MANRYKAFISYRHLPLDMRVATWVHRRIEHYVVPKALRKDGEKKLGRVFRDKDELPLSSNLGSSLLQALDDSEYLIVVCTPQTKESRWVMTEIDHFVSTHDRDHVLVILADGTAEESIPRQLCEQRSHEGVLVREVEPLAADIVCESDLRRRRLFRTESLRIIASLIGCAYDDLFRREQRFRIRRLALAMAAVVIVAAGFIGMLLNRNAEIRGNYEQALRNQSMYLAEESLAVLEGGDRLTAVALALEALPKEDGERPVVTRAEYALGRALDIYKSSGGSSRFRAAGMLSHAFLVDDFILNESCTILCSQCKDDKIYGWDAQNMSKLWTFDLQTKGLSGGIAGFARDSELIAWSNEEVLCIDAKNGERTWSVPVSQLSFESYVTIAAVAVPEKGGTIAVLVGDSVCVVDAKDGAILRSMPLPQPAADGQQYSIMKSTSQISPDGSFLATECWDTSSNAEGVVVLDLSDGSTLLFDHFDGPCFISDAFAFTDEGCVVYDVLFESDSTAGFGGESQIMRHDEHTLRCVDLTSGKLRWESVHESCSLGSNETLRLETGIADKPILVYAYANHLDLIDPTKGKLLAQTELVSRIVGVDVYNGRIFCITDGGAYGNIDPAEPDEWFSYDAFVDNLDSGRMYKGRAWVHQSTSNSIVCYEWPETYHNWVDMDIDWSKEEDGFFEDDWLIAPGCISFLDGDRLLFNDGDTTKPLQELRLAIDSKSDNSVDYELGFFEDGILTLTWKQTVSIDRVYKGVAYVDVETGELRVVPWEDEELDLVGIYRFGDGNKWVGILSERTAADDGFISISACVLDENLKPEKVIEVDRCNYFTMCYHISDQKGNMYLYLRDTDKSYRIDLVAAEVEECGDEADRAFRAYSENSMNGSRACTISEDGTRVALRQTPDECLVMDGAFHALYSIHSESSSIIAVFFTPDGRYLLSVEPDGCMRRYRASDGTLLGKTELYYRNYINEQDACSFRFVEDNVLALLVDDYLYLISTDDWEILTYVLQCRGYLEDQKRFVCYHYNLSERGFGTYSFYSLDDMIAYGNEVLNGWGLSEDQRERYGLG